MKRRSREEMPLRNRQRVAVWRSQRVGGYVARCLRRGLAVVLLAWIGSAAADEVSGRDAWLQAPFTQGKNWSREAVLERMAAATEFTHMARQQVIALLGEPGYAQEDYELEAGRTGRIDVYRLSAKNDRSFRMDYDSGDKATGDWIEQERCTCATCKTSAPAVAPATLAATILKKDATQQGKTLTMAQIENMLGLAGQISFSQDTAGGQVWMDYTEVWTITGSAHSYLVAGGHVPARDWQLGKTANLPADSYSVIAMAPECLPPPSKGTVR